MYDDVSFEGIRKLFRYISKFPNYKIHSQFPENPPSTFTRKLVELLRYLPKSQRVLKSEIIESDFELGINAGCIALEKIDEDKRDPFWHVDF